MSLKDISAPSIKCVSKGIAKGKISETEVDESCLSGLSTKLAEEEKRQSLQVLKSN